MLGKGMDVKYIDMSVRTCICLVDMYKLIDVTKSAHAKLLKE